MSESQDGSPESKPDADPAPTGGEAAAPAEPFALPDPDQVERAKLRRRIFGGYRPDDVESALRTREEQIAELRRDVAALWLAFGQHERTIRDMLVAVERLTGIGVDPPGARGEGRRESSSGGSATAAAPSGEVAEDPIGRQLGDLDQVLVAIEEATQSLERTYHDEIVAREEVAGSAPEGQGDESSAGGSEESADSGGHADEESGESSPRPDEDAGEEKPGS